MRFVQIGEFLEVTLSNGSKININGNATLRIPTFIIFDGYSLNGNGTYVFKSIIDNPNTGGSIEYIPSGFGIKRLGIADYRKVEQEICCYVPGEVSHIENIMASEYKDRTTIRTRRKEDTITESTEEEKEKLTDVTSTDRFEMNQEISSLLAEDTQLGASVNATYSQGSQSTGLFGLNAGADFANNTTTEESNSQAVTHAKDVTERALDRIVKKVKKERISKIVEEFQETNTHGFDNRKSTQHISGVYRWVDKIYRNQVVNYGKRLMYEFMIPEPAAFHNLASAAIKSEEAEVILKPIDPRIGDGKIVLASHKDITENNYQYWAGVYNAEIKPYPEKTIYVGKALDYFSTASKQASSKSDKVDIPEMYTTVSFIAQWAAAGSGDFGWGHNSTIRVGNSGDIYNNVKTALIGFKKEVPVTFATTNYHYFHFTVNIECALTAEAENQWKIDIFNKIIAAYEVKLSEYNAKVAQLKAQQTEKVRTNPLFYRQIENIVLRKNCIEYMASNEVLGAQSLLTAENEFTTIHALYNDPALEAYAAKIKFFEQAFEWNLMSYNFYPFYWASKKNWASLYNITETDDPIFRAFLQSGMARVIVTVKPGFEEVVNWYMATGQIWNGGQVPTMDDPLFLSIVDELRETTGTVEETWETRVPTSLTIIQAGSIGLEVPNALPCDDDCADNRLFDSDGRVVVDANGKPISINPFKITKEASTAPQARTIENIDINKGYLQLTTDTDPRQIVAQISIEAIKKEMGI